MEDYILQMEHITKTFPGVKALDDVQLKVRRGEIHSLVGENGAGKSTLMKVLSGVYPHGTYAGKMLIDGEEQKYSGIKDSEKSGVAIIYQELGLVRTMNVCENIFLGNERKKGRIIDWNFQYNKTQELLDELKLQVDPQAKVGSLGTGKQQLIEIAKALNKNVKLLILDEPTSSLTEQDTDNLLELLMKLREKGITCIFISHKLNEVFKISDSITILRDGKTITTKAAKDMDEQEIIASMVGRELTDRYPRKQHKITGDTILEVKNWTVENPENPEKPILDHVNMHVRKGEILGIAGLMGSGRTELAMSIFGAFALPVAGELYFEGKKISHMKHPREAIKAGIGYLSEDRKRYGLILDSDIRTNATMASLDFFTSKGILDLNRETDKVQEYIKKLGIKTPSMYQLTKNLSGGNQQKVVLTKSLLANPKVLFLDEPTRGIDIGAKYEIYQLMNELIEQGISIVMISSELPEIIGMSDRVYIMHEGKIRGEMDFSKEEVTQEKILFYAAGGQKDDEE